MKPRFDTHGLASPLLLLLLSFTLLIGRVLWAQEAVPAGTNAAPGWLTQPLSLDEALEVALLQNPAILKSQKDIEATHGMIIQTRAVVLPRLRAFGNYSFNGGNAEIALAPGQPSQTLQQDHGWGAGIRLEQSIYEGGRMRSAFRTARHLRDQAVQQHRSVINNTLLDVRTTYYNTLLAAEQILVNEKSVALLEKELEDARRRHEAGTVPKFDVLRAEVQVANAKPRVSRARNSWRIAKNNLATLLGYDLPTNIWENIPLQLSGRLAREPFDADLPQALAQAIENRPELAIVRHSRELAREEIVQAKSGYKPSIQLFGGYEGRDVSFKDDLGITMDGWVAGAQANWNLFDGLNTQGKVREARAREEQADVDEADTARRIELEVRTAYSSFVEAREVLEATEKVVEQAEEAVRLATSRYGAGTGTQLDVLAAETSLTEARTIQNEALRDYAVALAQLERAIGLDYSETEDVP